MNLKIKIKNLKLNKGFTLIELMIVIGVISILSVGVITILNPADQIQKANDSRRKSDLFQIQKALEQYYEDNGRYPAVSQGSTYLITNSSGADVVWGNPWTPYMNLIPKDPSYPNKTYVYYTPDGQSYYLYASLDRGGRDKDACNSGNACNSLSAQSPQIPEAACSQDGISCNYAVSSPNVSP